LEKFQLHEKYLSSSEKREKAKTPRGIKVCQLQPTAWSSEFAAASVCPEGGSAASNTISARYH
jgi:hypothetical protein